MNYELNAGCAIKESVKMKEHIEVADKIAANMFSEFDFMQQNEMLAHVIRVIKDRRLCIAKEMHEKINQIESSIEEMNRIL